MARSDQPRTGRFFFAVVASRLEWSHPDGRPEPDPVIAFALRLGDIPGGSSARLYAKLATVETARNSVQKRSAALRNWLDNTPDGRAAKAQLPAWDRYELRLLDP